MSNIPVFNQSWIFYWGALDEDGFQMQHHFRQHYPHTQSLLMDEDTVQEHLGELQEARSRQPDQVLQRTPAEQATWNLLKE